MHCDSLINEIVIRCCPAFNCTASLCRAIRQQKDVRWVRMLNRSGAGIGVPHQWREIAALGG
jgi:hypothetical protein